MTNVERTIDSTAAVTPLPNIHNKQVQGSDHIPVTVTLQFAEK